MAFASSILAPGAYVYMGRDTMEAEIGIIGGSGFYSLIEGSEKVEINTKYGKTSDSISVGTISGRKVAFIPRHGSRHVIPPHKVPYRANIEALSQLGVKRIIATNAVGSLVENYAPGDFVFFDQFMNMTHGRADSFYDEDQVAHVSPAEPYCSELRKIAGSISHSNGIKYHPDGTVVVINGPRFSTKAESKFFNGHGFQVINMTQYPEVMLAKEKAMCYLGIGIVTDYDSGLEGRSDIKPVNAEEVNRVFAKSIGTAKKLILDLVPKIPKERSCACKNALDGALIHV